MKRKSGKYYHPVYSLAKLHVNFKDGNYRTFYSNMRKDSAIGLESSAEELASRLLTGIFRDKWIIGLLKKNDGSKAYLQLWDDGKLTKSNI